MGYGAMQLAGPGVSGPPKDRVTAVAVLREAVASGVNHIDTADFYGPRVTNEIIREALHPYPEGLVIATKVGARRADDGSWHVAYSPTELIQAVHDNLRNLGVDRLDVVNLRLPNEGYHPGESPLEAAFTVLADLQRQGLIRHLGLSHATANQVTLARRIAPVVCVQNQYNLTFRKDDSLIDALNAAGIAYVPFFPLGGFTRLQSEILAAVAQQLGASALQTALAWLLQRAANVLLIPGTASLSHLQENLAAAELTIPAELMARLDAI